MKFAEKKWMVSLLLIIFILGFIIFLKMVPYLSGILGAFTIYIMVRNQMKKLCSKKHMRRSVAASLILVEVILCFIIPFSLVIWLIINKLQEINLDPQILISNAQEVVSVIKVKTGYNIFNTDNLTLVTAEVSKILHIAINSISSFIVNAIIMIFILYFLLIGNTQIETYIIDLLPFKKENKRDILHEARRMIISNAIGIPFLASIQGVVAYLGYVIFGAPNAVILAILTCFATILPVVGTAIIWLPVAIYLAIIGNWFGGIGLAVYGLAIIAISDNVMRFLLQKKIADIHPLITIFGVLIGLPLFGFWGVIFGPLLLSMFLLCINIFKREYVDSPADPRNL